MSYRDELMRGGCYSLALYLHRRTGVPLMALADNSGMLHHVFIADGGTAWDARGQVMLKDVAWYRGRRCAGDRFVDVTADQVEAMMRTDRLETHDPGRLGRFCRATPALRQLLADRPRPETTAAETPPAPAG